MSIPGNFGANLVMGLVSAMLYGITTLQTYLYYMHYSEDASIIKFIVAAIWVLDTLHVSFMCHMLYYYLITNYGDPTSFKYIVWSYPASVLVNFCVIAKVQFFFAHKIYCLCRREVRWLVTTPIILLALASFGFGIGMVVLMFVDNESTVIVQFRFSTDIPCGVAGVLCDVLITVSLCVLFHKSGSGSAFPRTKRFLNTLIVYAFNRCVLIVLVCIAELAGNVRIQDTWTMGLNFILGKLYANSLLASLNTRQYLRSQISDTVSSLYLGVVHFANLPKHSGDVGRYGDGGRRFDGRDVAVIDITTERAFHKTTPLRREDEV